MIEFAAAKGPTLHLDEGSVLDIGACLVEGVDVSPGKAVPDDGDLRISHSVEGFLFTCGPDHIRHPEPIGDASDGRSYPLHGSFSATPARVISLRFDDRNAECRADVDVTTADGRTARLERLWRIDGATGEVVLSDRIINTSHEAMPVFLMYHMNIGGRLFDDAVRLSGQMLEGGGFPWAFGEGPGGIFCVEAPATDDGWAEVSLGPIAAIGGRTLRVSIEAETLPFLQVWRNQRTPVDVLGIEPVSHRWVSRRQLEEAGEFNILEPGEGRSFGLRFAFVGGA